jgi:hypothetical protein
MDPLAKILFVQAIREDRAGELLECLFDGGTATFDPTTNTLMMLPKSMLDEVMEVSFGHE